MSKEYRSIKRKFDRLYKKLPLTKAKVSIYFLLGKIPRREREYKQAVRNYKMCYTLLLKLK